MNSSAIVEAIRELVAQQKVKIKEVAIGVRGHSVIIKRISMPFMSQEDLDESIQWEAEQYIPFDVKDVNIDTQILTPQADAAGQMDVLLVAAKKDMINDFTSVCAEAGLTATVVDVDAFAVQNAFEANYPQTPGQPVVLINVGAAVTNINIVNNGIATFTRDITVGGNAFTEEIQKQLNISAEEAEALKVGGARRDRRRGPAGGGAGHPGRRRPDGRRDPALPRLPRRHRARHPPHPGLPVRRHGADPGPLQGDRAAGRGARWRS